VAYPDLIGHLFDGHQPDIIGNDPQKYKNYVLALYATLGGDASSANQNAALQALLDTASSLAPGDAAGAISAMQNLANSGRSATARTLTLLAKGSMRTWTTLAEIRFRR
jgi:hypothetical protein